MENENKQFIEKRSKTLARFLRHDKTYVFLEHRYRLLFCHVLRFSFLGKRLHLFCPFFMNF